MTSASAPAGDEAAVGTVLQQLETTRSIRRFRSVDVSDDQLATLLYAATRAPSGGNRQPYRFVVLRRGAGGPAAAARALLADEFRRRWDDKRSTDLFDEGSGRDPGSAKARAARAMQQFVDGAADVPVIVLACLRGALGGELLGGASIYPACQNLLIAARAMGLGGTMMIWHRGVEPQLKSILDIPDDVAIAATVLVGVPAGHHGPLRRRPLGELVDDGAWGVGAPWAKEPEGASFTIAGHRQPSAVVAQ